MLGRDILWSDQGRLSFGEHGEKAFGQKNFLELFSVFLSPPLFSILHGRQELGFVDELTFLGKRDGPRVLLLGGRAWMVTHVDWQRRLAYVERSDAKGQSRWKGLPRELDYPLCQAIKRVLASNETNRLWSRRAKEQIDTLRQEFGFLDFESTVILKDARQEAQWWTFAGTRANATLARALAEVCRKPVEHDAFTVTFDAGLTFDDIEKALSEVRSREVDAMRPLVDEAAVKGVKFFECIPEHLAIEMLERRLADPEATKNVLEQDAAYVKTSS
jgi:ATP-dependent Lhr-like helicase